MTEPHGQYRHPAHHGDSHAGVHLSNQLNGIHSLLLLILTKVENAECKCNSKPKRWPKWMTPQTIFWMGIIVLAVGGHITFDQAKVLLTGMPK